MVGDAKFQSLVNKSFRIPIKKPVVIKNRNLMRDKINQMNKLYRKSEMNKLNKLNENLRNEPN